MKKTFQKTLVAASVGALLAVAGVAANAGTASTDNLLFPYVTTVTGSYTFLSVVARGGNAAAPAVHFTYATKATSSANSVACTHLDGDAKMTPNDLMSFEVQNKVDVIAAFGDTTSTPKYFPSGAVGNDRHGLVIVNNAAAGVYGGAAAYLGANLYGEARIINTVAGLAFGYSTEDLHTATGNTPATVNFAAATGPDGGLSVKVLSWFADPTVATSWFVQPLDTEQVMGFNGNASQTYGLYNTGTQNVVAALPVVGAALLGHYNANEAFQSSASTTSVTCLGVVDRATMLGALNAPWSANGGWGVFMANGAATPTSTGSLVYRMETTSATGGKSSFITRTPLL